LSKWLEGDFIRKALEVATTGWFTIIRSNALYVISPRVLIHGMEAVPDYQIHKPARRGLSIAWK